MELFAEHLHFPGRLSWTRRRQVCVMGGVTVRLGRHTLSRAEDNRECCLSVAAIRLLRSLFENHFAGAYQPLIPFHPARMIPTDDRNFVFFDCHPIGIDFDVIHEDGNVLFRSVGKIRVSIPYGEYRAAVIQFARQVKEMHLNSSQRVIKNETARLGYRAFLRELQALLTRAKAGYLPKPPRIEPPSFRAPIALADKDIKEIKAAGITTTNGVLLPFREAAYHFYRLYGGSGKCVGELDLSTRQPCVRIYTHPNVTEIFFIPQTNPLRRSLSYEERFRAFKARLVELGYTLADVTCK